MHPYEWNWYKTQQEREEKIRKENKIFLINQELKNLLKKLQRYIKRVHYMEEARELNRYISCCSIWDVTYRNNMENVYVAISQAVLIKIILEKEKELPIAMEVEQQMKHLLERLSYIDPNVYVLYQREFYRMNR